MVASVTGASFSFQPEFADPLPQLRQRPRLVEVTSGCIGQKSIDDRLCLGLACCATAPGTTSGTIKRTAKQKILKNISPFHNLGPINLWILFFYFELELDR